jgi:hypothetical protein
LIVVAPGSCVTLTLIHILMEEEEEEEREEEEESLLIVNQIL